MGCFISIGRAKVDAHDNASDPQFVGSADDVAIAKIPEPESDKADIPEFPSFFSSLAKPTIFEYQFLNHIGHGAQSDIFLTLNTETSQNFAAKIYDKGYLFHSTIGDVEAPYEKVTREIQIMSTIHNKNCLGLIEVIDDEPTNAIIMILPYADAGPLAAHSWKSNPITEQKARDVFSQIASGLRYLHSLNIIHRDLKPENILTFSDGTVCIADFSVSMFLEDPNQMLEDTEGTPAFYSPEECKGESFLGKPADVWAFGMIMYVMIYGKLPFYEADGDGVFFSHFFKISQKIINEDFDFPAEKPISNELRDLFSKVLDKNPKTRITIEDVCRHPWMRESVEKLEASGL